MASSAEVINGGSDHQHMVVEMAINDADASVTTAADVALAHEISPLLTPSSSKTPKINIFSVSYPRRKPREQVSRYTEAEISVFSQIISWAWGGSRFSGLLCMALSSIIYCMMGALWETFTAQPIPLFETAFTRCTIILILSYLWLQRTGQPLFGPTHVRKLFLGRAIIGYLSLLSFTFCIQRLPLSQAIVLSFSTPIMAATMAIFILHEKLKVAEIGGLVCSFFGVVFIFWPKLTAQEAVEDGNVANAWGSYHLYAIVFGLFSSVSGGVCYCLIRAGAKASDQPVVTVFIFGLLGTPAAAVCIFIFQDFVFPSLYSLLLMIILGLLAFLAEVLLARGLHLEKTSKVVNIQYIEGDLQYTGSGIGENGDDLIRVLRELTAVQRKIADLEVELRGRKDDKNVAHLTHVSEMEKKCETLARITTILKDVIQNKDRIIARLQQPYSLDCIPVEAEYQKQFSELLMKAASDYGALTASVADFQWTQNFKEPPSVWGEMLRPIPVALASCTRFFEAMSAMRESFATLQKLRVGHHPTASLPSTPASAKDPQRMSGDSDCITPPPWRNEPSFDDLSTKNVRKQQEEHLYQDGYNEAVDHPDELDGTSHRRLSWPPSVKKNGL